MTKKKYRLSAREKRVDDWFEWPMIFVTLALLVTLIVPIVFDLATAWVNILAVLNLVIWFAFYIELFAKLYVSNNFLESVKRNWVLVIIAVSPLFLPFRLMRLSRLVSALRFLGFQRFVTRLRKDIKRLVYNVEYILITLLIFVGIAGLSMWQIETRFGGDITTLSDALWWAVITVTTIGYGDIIPTSPEGRILGAGIGLMGAILFMVFVARISILFVHDEDILKLRRDLKESKG